MDSSQVLRAGTVDIEEELADLMVLRPACARSSLLAHRTGEQMIDVVRGASESQSATDDA